MCSEGTMRGIKERAAPAPNDENAAAKNANTKQSATCGCGSAALTTSPTTDAAVPASVHTSSRRLSRASAAAPPISVRERSGTSSTIAIAPTANVDFVSWYTWNGSATYVTSPRTNESVWPIQRRR